MTVSYTPIDTPDEWLEVEVPDPGAGYLLLRRRIGRPGLHAPEVRTVAGPLMGTFLEQLREAALDPEAPQPVVLRGRRYSGADLRVMLRAVERAVLLATAGTDRYERVYDRGLDQEPLPPLCASCNLGSEFSQMVVLSERCMDLGHRPFARPHDTWESATAAHDESRQTWPALRRQIAEDDAAAAAAARDPRL